MSCVDRSLSGERPPIKLAKLLVATARNGAPPPIIWDGLGSTT
jgi:hypothetical protein